ncbi:MAG: flagellar hook-length control protein FliK [Aestuariivirga sp.]
MNQSQEFDIKPAAGASVLRPRAGGQGRHHGKMPDIFPDVLADVALSKSVALEAVSALAPSEKSATRDDEVDTGDKKQDSLPDEKILQPAVPVDIKQYLQIIAAVAQKQTGGSEPAPSQVFPTASPASGVTGIETQPPVTEIEAQTPVTGIKTQTAITEIEPQTVVAKFEAPTAVAKFETQTAVAKFETQTVAAKIETQTAVARIGTQTATTEFETQDVKTDQTEDDDSGNAPKELAHSAVPKFLEQKTTNPREPADHMGKDSLVLPNQPAKLSSLPEPKETPQPKAVDAEQRVIKMETSFSPAASAPLVVQFAKMIANSLDGPVQSPVAAMGNPVADPRPDVVKSLQIQLNPDALGKIKVAMHLRGDELRLQIEVTNKAVETLLLNDHQALKDLMGQAGYDVKDASISIAVSPAELSPPQRGVAASDSSQGSMVGQGGRQHPGTSEENQNPFQKTRGQHGSASDFENGQETKLPAPGSRRSNGVFV